MSSAGNATGSEDPTSYPIGQVVYTANAGTTGSVTQSIQKLFEISVVTGLEEAKV